MPEHSPEPWEVYVKPPEGTWHDGFVRILDANKRHIATVPVSTVHGVPTAKTLEVAQRITACVNACRHLPADYLQYLADEDRFLVGTSLRNVTSSIAAYEKLVGENRLADLGIAAARLVD